MHEAVPEVPASFQPVPAKLVATALHDTTAATYNDDANGCTN